MMWKRNTFWQLAAWSIVCCYALVISGLPLPVDALSSSTEPSGIASERIAAKDRTKPFPCMNKPCGCLSAKQCFQKCCCHTPDETLAWAKQHDVSPEILHALQRRVGQHANPKQMQIDSGQNIQKTCCRTNDLQSDAPVKTSCEETIVDDMCGRHQANVRPVIGTGTSVVATVLDTLDTYEGWTCICVVCWVCLGVQAHWRGTQPRHGVAVSY